MKNNLSHIQDSNIPKKEETEKNSNILSHHKYNTTIKKGINEEKKVYRENIPKTKIKKIENNLCLAQNIKYNHNGKKVTKTKIISKNSFIKSANETLNINKTKAVKKILSPKKDLCPYNTITSKKYSLKNQKFNIKVDNEILNMPQYNKIDLLEKKENIKSQDYSSENNKSHQNKILSCNNIRRKIKKETNIIDISDSEDNDSLIINNEDENEDNNQVINTTFPKLASNPFLSVNSDNKDILNTNNESKLFFSPNLIRKKGRCIQQTQLYYKNNSSNGNNIKSTSKTKTVLSINSSTTQNSNDTINNINVYNLDSSKIKKINDLNSNNNNININIEGEIDKEKNIINKNNNNNNEENNYNLNINNLLILVKNGETDKILEFLQKIKDKNIINFNYKNKEDGNTILHYICQEKKNEKNIKIIKYLFQFNCDPNIKNNNLETPLHLASKNGDIDICKILIENGALLNIYDVDKKTPIHYACSNNNIDLLNYFYEIFIETDIDEKICDNLTNNKEINLLFKNYLQKENLNTEKILRISSDLNTPDINIKNNKNNNIYILNHITCSSKNNNILNKNNQNIFNKMPNKEKNKSSDKIKKINLNREQLNNLKNQDSKNKNNKTDSYSNLSLNTMNSGTHENEKVLITNLDIYKYNKKINKNKTNNNNGQNKFLIKNKNYIKQKTMNNPFSRENKKDNDSKNKNKEKEKEKDKEKDNYYEVNKTYDNSNINNGKANINIPKKIKNNCLSINQRKKNNMNTITKEKSQPKFSTSSKNINSTTNKIKQLEYMTEYKNNSKFKKMNDKPNVPNNIEKKNLHNFFNNSPPKPKNIQLINQTMDANINMDVTSINAINKMSLSLNLVKEEEKISAKNFICLALLGRGSFGEVYLVQKINTKKNYAMKILRKERIMGQNLSKYAIAERNVLSLSHHPFIVKLNYAFQTLTKLFLILEYCPGGDLAKHLSYEKKFEEKRAKFYLCEILLALEDLHKRNIIFRDLKPDNVVLDEEGHCKLTDFGLSKEGIDNNQYTKSFCGSIAYLAPEVLKKQGHGKAVDWYLLGVLLYEMLTGVTPYYDRNKNNLFYNIEQGKLTIPNFVSENAKSLLKGLLQKDPKKRLGGSARDAEEIKEHKFFEDVDWQKVYEKKIKPPKALTVSNNMYIFNKPKYFADENNLEEIFGDNSLEGWTFINRDEIEM